MRVAASDASDTAAYLEKESEQSGQSRQYVILVELEVVGRAGQHEGRRSKLWQSGLK